MRWIRAVATAASLASLASLALLIPGIAGGQVRNVTLQEAIELALRNSPTIVQAQGEAEVARASRLEAFGDWLPTITGSGGWSQNSASRFDPNTQRTVSGSATSYSTGLMASLVVFDGFRRGANRRSAGANVASADASLTSQRFRVTLQTKRTFFRALAAQELVRVAETRIERADGQLRISREKLAAGTAVRSDTLRSFVELANARLQLVNAQTQLATASADLARLVGMDGPVGVVEPGGTDVLASLDTTALRQEALMHSPSVYAAVAQSQAADAQVTASRSQYFPSITASYSQNWAGDAPGNLNRSWSPRLSLSWPLFNGFSRETALARAHASAAVARSRAQDSRREVNAELTRQFAALQAARVRMGLARASHAAAAEELRVQQERYRLGVATIVEVLSSEENLDQAAVDLVEAKFDFFVVKAEIETLVGREI